MEIPPCAVTIRMAASPTDELAAVMMTKSPAVPFFIGLREMLLATDDGSVGKVDLMFDLREAVPFSGIAKENRLDAHILKSNEKLLSFRKGNIVVVLAVND
jgi:hypothetical protein